MSHLEPSKPGQSVPSTNPKGRERSNAVRVFHGFLTVLLTLLRTLMGFVLVTAGFTWLTREDPGGNLATQLSRQLDSGMTIAFYAPFLKSVVLPNVNVFAWLVGMGELLAGISLFLGLAHRLGAAGAIFLFVNYGLMGGPNGLLSHGMSSLIVLAPVLWLTGRKFGLDRWTYRKWPKAKIW